jgi:FkbM family methyltransferase
MHPPRWLIENRRLELLVSRPFLWLAKKSHYRYSIVKRRGLFFLADLDSIVGRHLYSRGFWEFRQIEFLEGQTRELQKSLGGEWWFVDVGANCGIFSLYFSKSGLFKRVISFEPDRNNLVHLRMNMLMNKDTRIEVNEVGLSDRNGDAILKDDKGVSSTLEFVATGKEVVQDISIRRFDDEYQIEGKYLVIKMDIEGHELKALSGMTKTLARNKCLLQVETWDKFEALSRQLGELGYANFHAFGTKTSGGDFYFKNF